MELSLPVPATAATVLAQLRLALPGTGAIPERPLVAVNQVHAFLDTPVTDGDEVAFLPPLAGG